MKRILALIILISLFAPIFISTLPTSASAATSTDEIRTAVTQVYEELLSRTSPGEGGASDGAMQLLNHAISGGGRDLIMDESDNFTGMLLRSNMFREGFIEGVTDTFNQLLNNYNHSLVSGITYQYYEHEMKYSYGSYAYSEEIVADKTLSGNPTNSVEWSGAKNSSDDTLILLAGSCITKVIIEKTKIENSQAKYHAHIIFSDNFDFNKGNYSGSDAQLANMLNWLGGLMAAGAFITPFNFEAHLEFEIDFANTCTHESANYRWDFDGDTLISTGADVNDLARLQGTTENGRFIDTRYQMARTVRLNPGAPWNIEWQMSGPWYDEELKVGKKMLSYDGLAATPGVTNLSIHGVKKYVVFSSINGSGSHQFYGIDLSDYGIEISDLHTYRLDNRPNADGSNMVYLSVDGVELGPMNIHQNTGTVTNWISGQTLIFGYMGTPRYILDQGTIHYLQIWENGEDNTANSYYRPQTVAPTCTANGYTGQVCAQCGDTIKESTTPALGHSFDANGSCTRCGHTVPVITGTYTTDLVMPAADLGVSAPDSVLRATLTFTEDGNASASWEAVDLTAFRLFFRDMFVSSYYAMAYGAGITDINEIEAFCMESTGMSVTAYMDTIVTEVAMEASFTPTSTAGTYSYNADHTAIFTDMVFMDVPSDAAVENSFVLGNGTLYLNAASWGKPDYTFVCTAK